MWGQVTIGSNIYRDTPGLISAGGKQVAHVERGEDGQLLLTMEIYDGAGEHVSRLRRNAWVFHDDRFEITTNPASLVLHDTGSGLIVLEVNVTGPDSIEVPRGHFFTHAGHPISITPDAIRIGTATLSGNTFENCTTGIGLG